MACKFYWLVSLCLILVSMRVQAISIIKTVHPKSFLMNTNCDELLTDTSFLVSQRFDYNNSLILMRFSWLVHQDESTIVSNLEAMGFEDVSLFAPDSQGYRAMAARLGGVGFVAFRGSESTLDTLEDAFFVASRAQRDDPFKGRMHTGFYWHYRNIYKELGPLLDQWQQQQVQTYYIGHSLGGTAAQLTALKRQSKGDRIAGLYTYGQPRVGDEEFLEYSNASGIPYFRIEIERDITSQLPPTAKNAKIVSHVVSHYLPLLRQTLENFVKWLGYGGHSGQAYKLASQKIIYSPQDLVREYSFWQLLKDSISANGLSEVLNRIKSQNNFHHPNSYICEIAGAIRTRGLLETDEVIAE